MHCPCRPGRRHIKSINCNDNFAANFLQQNRPGRHSGHGGGSSIACPSRAEGTSNPSNASNNGNFGAVLSTFSLSGEGVPALHSVLATSLVWRHTSDFVTSKACRVRSLRAVAQAILKVPKCLPRAFRTACGLAARRQRPSSSLVTSRACRFRSLRAVAKHIKSIKCIKWQFRGSLINFFSLWGGCSSC